MSKLVRSMFSLCIIFTLLFSANTRVFAESSIVEESLLDEITVLPLNANTLLLSDGENPAILSFVETQSEIRYELRDDSNVNYIVFDKLNQTLYSSYTGNFVSVDNIATLSNPNDLVAPLAVGDVVDTDEYIIYYSQIAALVGDVYSAYDLAVTLVAIIGVFQGIAVTTITLAIYGAIKGEIFNTIVDAIENNVSGGVIVTINTIEIEKHQGGRPVTGYTLSLGGIETF